jgi:hypothetical protein
MTLLAMCRVPSAPSHSLSLDLAFSMLHTGNGNNEQLVNRLDLFRRAEFWPCPRSDRGCSQPEREPE